jgi:hypothetical protein
MNCEVMKLKPLSYDQSVLWYSASLVFGLVIVLFALDSGYLSNGDTFDFAVGVFGGSWLVVVVLMRFSLQEVDPTSLKTIFGFTRKK